MLSSLAGQLATIEVRLQGLEAKLLARHKADPRSQLLATIPGVGPIGAVSFSLKSLPSRRRGCQMPRCFVPVVTPACAGQAFAAWLGITPRERSTAGRQRQGPISREGDEGLRRLLVLGATAVIQQAKPGRASPPAFARAGSGCCNCWRASQRSSRRSRWPTRSPGSLGPCW